jgi:hypothetical protein
LKDKRLPLTFERLSGTLRSTRFNIEKFYKVLTFRLCVLRGNSTFALYNINSLVFYNRRAQVPKFKYIGSIFTEDGKNKEDIIQRTKEDKVIFNNKKQLLCSNNLNFEIKKKLIKSFIWSVALYGSEHGL